ncbi:hypothetical protein NAV11_07655 [Pseudomonas songnenensis]|uniref:ATP-binding protein n=1 Tax=Pseudomonas songnenensis TaxID=1176259 RepID=A0ABX9UXQ5_9PSED|nr:hypothetical protein [Pseudomonas songnenensis]MCQ4299784.1 hypothetical protein [Pseudomonas songnenensis]RMH98176.1 hypothetical protein EA798_07150 [Pseudomonas songnenensis]
MPAANWDVFSELPGAADENFEKLCRSLVRRHYGRYGRFKQLANQPGVEFHLQLTESCDLGAPQRWIGWQCKWYELTNGQDLGAARKQKIVEGMEKTRKHVPGVTDWKLWTHHTLTKGDQEWFFALEKDRFPELKLELLTATDIEDLLVGPGALLRETYFGELVLTPALLAEQHRLAAAPFKRRYQQEVHVVVGAEGKVLRHLGGQAAWESLEKISSALKTDCRDISSLTAQLKVELKAEVDSLLARATGLAGLLDDLHTALGRGDFDFVQQMLAANPPQPVHYDRLLSKLRGARSGGAPLTANLVADIHAVSSALLSLERSIGVRAVAVLAAAGEGKSELAVKVTQPDGDLPGGVLLLGKNLHAGQGLDDLVSAFKISGRPAESFDRLVEAVDAAGQRAGKRIPIVIDGLNEAEDPRNWRDELARAEEFLEDFPYVLLVVTLRNEFAQMCLPEDFPQVEHNGFLEDPQTAIDKYFEYYKIDATDADLPIEFLQHPLTLRIFCEVANPRRQHIVGVEALPSSLASLFEAYFNKVAERVAQLSPTAHRIYQDEVQDALLTIAGLLWEGNARSVEFKAARTAVQDVGRWDVSVIRALESEGVLVRTTSEEGGQGIAFSYDLMAGHMMARHLLARPALAQWLQSDEGRALFQFREPGSHTFAYDVFQALVGLYPQHTVRRQLWQDLLDENLVMNALLLTTQSDPRHIGRETVERFARAMQESKPFARFAFKRLRGTRAARAHPFDMDFLHGVLLAMPNTQRDLFWSEWVRESSEEVEDDFKFLSSRWKSGDLDEREIRRARWVMWTLTSTSRSLRDVATKTLYEFATRRPTEFFRLAVEAIAVSDPYVPERMFAAAYGAALTTWSDINAVEMREALPRVAREIYQAMFAPSATHPTWHALYQQYCLGTIAIARMVDPACLSADEAAHLLPPFSHLPSPFVNMPQYNPAVIERAKREAIRMDFGNYTMGRLIPGRSNYDDSNPEYQRVLPAIVSRMLVLGYDPAQFEAVDRQMNSGPRMGGDKHKVDRYGKKYGWIAYFEMWGVRYAQGLLAERRSARPSDADIDPTFPLAATRIDLPLQDLFSGQPTGTGDWVVRGPQPDYRGILEIEEIDGLSGPWVVLDGFLEQNAPADDRQVFTFLRGVLVDSGEVDHLCTLFTGLEYPGNDAIPEEPSFHYTYAGEMPFSSIPGMPVANEREDDRAEYMVSADRWSNSGVTVDIPVQKYNWESYHSVLNQSSGASLPSKLLCKALSLRYHANKWDLLDASGVASLYREVGEYGSQISGSFSYLRRDLLDSYLTQSGKMLVWLMWGERGFHHRSAEAHNLHEYYAHHQHIHKRTHIYQPASSTQS